MQAGAASCSCDLRSHPGPCAQRGPALVGSASTAQKFLLILTKGPNIMQQVLNTIRRSQFTDLL